MSLLDQIADQVRSCTRCPLHEGRTQAVKIRAVCEDLGYA
jgi:uracil-DNA glycosylase